MEISSLSHVLPDQLMNEHMFAVRTEGVQMLGFSNVQVFGSLQDDVDLSVQQVAFQLVNLLTRVQHVMVV